MKILFVSDYYPPYIKGGAEVSTSLLANWLFKKNHEVIVACTKLASEEWTENGIKAYPIINNFTLKGKNFPAAISYGLGIVFLPIISAISVLGLARRFK